MCARQFPSKGHSTIRARLVNLDSILRQVQSDDGSHLPMGASSLRVMQHGNLGTLDAVEGIHPTDAMESTGVGPRTGSFIQSKLQSPRRPALSAP